MSTIGSSLSKGEDGTALINPSVLNQIAGLPKDLTRSAFDAAVTQERARITNNGTGVWNNGEKISILGELGTRIWFVGGSAAASHARNVSFQGRTYTLAGDANVFGATNGAPSSGTGANGDIMVDVNAGLCYGPKANGTWSGTVLDTISARSNDPRFDTGATVSLGSAPYNAPLDGQPHTMTQAAALAMYPNCGATRSIAQDTAAWLQAEYDIRTSAVRRGTTVIWLPPMSKMVVTEQLRLQAASNVWFHAGPGCTLLTAGTGTTPAISVENATSLAQPLRNFFMQAGASAVSTPGDAGGVAWTGYTTGASAIQFVNCQGIFIHNVAWSGYDEAIIWGNHVFGIRFMYCAGSGNNIAWGWENQAFGLDSMEALYFISGSLSNNNYGFKLDSIYGPNEQGTYFPQGGSVFIQGTSIDYNVVRQGEWENSVNNYAIGSLHITKCHIETTGACSGNTRARVLSSGPLFFVNNELVENDGNSPPWFVEVADGTQCTMIGNRVNSTTIALMGSPTSGPKVVFAYGNMMQYIYARPIAMLDGNGTLWQPNMGDGCSSQIPDHDPNPATGSAYYGTTDVFCNYGSAGDNFTLDAGGWPAGATFRIWCISNPVTIRVKAGATLGDITHFTGPFVLSTPGTFAIVRAHSPTEWIIVMPHIVTPNAFPMSFAGVSGAAPTGVKAFSGTNAGTITYDGAGNLQIPAAASGDLLAAGIVPDGKLIEVNFAAGTANRAFAMRTRVQSDGSCIFIYCASGKLNCATLAPNGAGSNFDINTVLDPSTINSFGFSGDGGVIHVFINGAQFHDFNVSIGSAGYLGFAGNNGATTLISTIKIT